MVGEAVEMAVGIMQGAVEMAQGITSKTTISDFNTFNSQSHRTVIITVLPCTV